MTDAARESAAILRDRGVDAPVDAAIVLGTGLGELAEGVDPVAIVPYADLPAFPQPGVSGHAGQVVVGRQQGRLVAYLQGRAHYYEDGDPRAMAGALEALAHLECQSLVLTAACGSLRVEIAPGSLMLVSDHINLSGTNPLIGAKGDSRFVSLVDAYDVALRQRMMQAAASQGMELPEGVYMWFSGPSFETPAEIRMARALGADVVGMSVVPEVILARRLGLRLAAVSMITNYAAGFQEGAPTHAQTRAIAATGGRALATLFDAFLKG